MADAVADGENDTVPSRPGGSDNPNADDNHPPPDPVPIADDDDDDDEEQQDTQSRRRPIISRTESNSSRPREATELGEFVDINNHDDDGNNNNNNTSRTRPRSTSPASSTPSTASISSGEYRATPQQSITVIHREASAGSGSTNKQHRFPALRRFWMRHVVLNVPQHGNRDYFALERTFLAYMRTSATFAMQGALVAQIFRLRKSTDTNPHRLDFHAVSIPLSIAYHSCAILVALMGAYRFLRQQNAIARGKIIVGGWELQWIGILTLLAALTLFALAVAITIELG